MSSYTVEVAFDSDARVWYIERSDIPGLNVEASSYEELVEVVLDFAPELIQHNLEGGDMSRMSFPVNVVQHATAVRAQS